MSKIAAIVGDADGVKEYDRRSKFYRNLWDPKTKFFRPRNAAGEFVEPFDPIICGGMCSYAVFSMMGFYPVTPGLPEYQLGSPVFSKVTIHQRRICRARFV